MATWITALEFSLLNTSPNRLDAVPTTVLRNLLVRSVAAQLVRGRYRGVEPLKASASQQLIRKEKTRVSLSTKGRIRRGVPAKLDLARALEDSPSDDWT